MAATTSAATTNPGDRPASSDSDNIHQQIISHSLRHYTSLFIKMTRPIICVFAYKRPAHLEETLSSLEANQEACEIPVVIYVDAAKYPADLRAVANVLEVAHKPRRFKSIEVIARDTNLGLYSSLTQGISEALQTHESVIVLEDDIKTSPFFLQYILKGLEVYRDVKDVASIHAYTPPIATSLPETFFLRGADCWGWATWRDRWELFRHDASRMAQEIRERGLAYEFNLNGHYDYLGMLDSRANGRNSSWAICWHASCFLSGKLTLYPGKSLVKNTGLDGSGEHCGRLSHMETEVFADITNISPIPCQVNSKIFLAYCNHFRKEKPMKVMLSSALVTLKRSFRETKILGSRKGLLLRGPYRTYNEASLLSTGYDNPIILTKINEAIIEVLDGRAVYERDGSSFKIRPKELPVEAILTTYSHQVERIIDFGGGLGGTFISYSDCIPQNTLLHVIEQKSFVNRGKLLADRYGLVINFHDNLEDISNQEIRTLAIFSSVLMYLPDWRSTINRFINYLTPKLILIDRQALNKHGGVDSFWIQDNGNYYGKPVTYPFVLPSMNILVNILKSYDYSILEKGTHPLHHGWPSHYYYLFAKN